MYQSINQFITQKINNIFTRIHNTFIFENIKLSKKNMQVTFDRHTTHSIQGTCKHTEI